MKLDTRRQWIGRFLLVVYLSMLTTSMFHVHEHGEAGFVCQDCIRHVHHSGHITYGGVLHGDCLLCSFLSTSYLVAEVIALATMALVLCRDFFEQISSVVCQTKRAILLRGPPVCL